MSEFFFQASKAAWVILAPSNALTLLLLAGLALLLRPRGRRWGRRLLVVGALGLGLGGATPLGPVLVSGLEHRFAPVRLCKSAGGAAYAGVIVLGGALSSLERDGQRLVRLGEAADRVRLAAELARRLPGAPVVISGGLAFETAGAPPEAALIAALLVDLGVEAERIVAEGASRSTAENAVFTAGLTAGTARPWLLVTSGFHMPRAMATFQAQGVAVIAAPTDWLIDPNSPWQGWNAADRLRLLDIAAKEYLGLVAYRLTGRTRELAPRGGPAACG